MSELNPQPPVDHSVKVPHLVFGLLFLGVAGIWALVVTDVITEDRLPVLAPAVLIAAGIVGLAASLANTRNRLQRAVETQAEPQAEPPAENRWEPEPEVEPGTEPGLPEQTREIR